MADSSAQRENIEQYEYTPPHDLPYDNEDTIFENNSFIVELREIDHRTASVFNINDHLFQLSILPKKNKPIRISDLFELLDHNITKALDLLKERYTDNLHSQIYATIIDNNINNGINVGNYSIKADSQIITNSLLNSLESYLQSNESHILNDSFCVQFKVLSVAHVRHKIEHSSTFQLHTVGHSEREKYPNYFFNFPSNCYLHKSNCFADMCLVLSVIFGIFQLECQELAQYGEFLKVKNKLNDRYEIHRKKACTIIHEKVAIHKQNYPLSQVIH